MLYFLLFIFASLQFADGYTTSRILANGGRELNPVLDRLFVLFGVRRVLSVVKIAMCVLVFGLSQWLQVWMIGCCDIIYLVVVVHNWRQMNRGNS